MGKIKDLTGKKFGKLLVLGNKGSKKVCLCDCGKICEIDTNHLVTGHSKSCGCGNARNWKTALGLSTTNLYKVWRGMLERCYNKNSIAYKWYGLKGITVCEEWQKSKNFLDWALKNGYKKGLTIDRIDTSKGYSPDNCRWVTMKEQTRNTSRNIFIETGKGKMCLKDFCEKYNIKYEKVIYYKKAYNVSYEDAIFVIKNKEWNNRTKCWENK